MDKKTKALALGVVLSGAFLAGCGVPQEVMDHLATLDSQVAEAQSAADEALSRAAAAENIAHQANETAQAAEELARQAIECCDLNTDRLDTMMHDMQKK